MKPEKRIDPTPIQHAILPDRSLQFRRLRGEYEYYCANPDCAKKQFNRPWADLLTEKVYCPDCIETVLVAVSNQDIRDLIREGF